MKGLMKRSINGQGISYWVINKTLKECFQIWSSLGQSNLFMLLPHPFYLPVHCFRPPDKRGLIVNKVNGLTGLWTPAEDQNTQG